MRRPGARNWTCRTDEEDWTVESCGYANDLVRSRQPTPVASVAADVSGALLEIDLTETVPSWVADASSNFGIAFFPDSTEASHVMSSDSSADDAIRPRLRVTFEIPP